MKYIYQKKISQNLKKNIKKPVIISIPHSGRDYSLKYTKNNILKGNDVRCSEDPFVDILFDKEFLNNFSFFIARFPRSFVDLNRGPYEINHETFSNIPKNFKISETTNNMNGYGVIPSKIGSKKLYGKSLSWKNYNYRMKDYHNLYYDLINQEIKKLKNIYNEIIIIDFHSMPSQTISGPLNYPKFVLGDLFGKSCSHIYKRMIKNYFDNKKTQLSINYPYAGKYFLEQFGKPIHGINAIQFEIRRDLYMNESEYTLKKDKLYNLKVFLSEFLKFVEEFTIKRNYKDIAAE
ncbi:MAG: hypothetical protein CMA40_00100 [Euryarchaeota archaeon]|nr:hypothetical protein [Euryarchaeota archaeon]|tara:strand:- start:3339 stop:4211 length:873 start_codon:yes stop_codon:yes gene_type:complete